MTRLACASASRTAPNLLREQRQRGAVQRLVFELVGPPGGVRAATTWKVAQTL